MGQRRGGLRGRLELFQFGEQFERGREVVALDRDGHRALHLLDCVGILDHLQVERHLAIGVFGPLQLGHDRLGDAAAYPVGFGLLEFLEAREGMRELVRRQRRRIVLRRIRHAAAAAAGQVGSRTDGVEIRQKPGRVCSLRQRERGRQQVLVLVSQSLEVVPVPERSWVGPSLVLGVPDLLHEGVGVPLRPRLLVKVAETGHSHLAVVGGRIERLWRAAVVVSRFHPDGRANPVRVTGPPRQRRMKVIVEPSVWVICNWLPRPRRRGRLFLGLLDLVLGDVAEFVVRILHRQQ